ncbi:MULTISPECIES: MFS transporter [Henriciella]|jgi:MFS family permease|uniref:MFS transporter n=1 Tax=Henriciella pelagia TaxID=1977912 RepID=A0ABQ1JR58_9PROT|nr:MFS transporter [Henriciella pelagia]GGB72562.1 MFS transporter [Henriciella pelagia]
MADYRNVWVLIAAVVFLQLGGGVLGVVTPLGLETLGVSPALIGAIAAGHAVGFMAGAWTSSNAIIAFGNIRVFSAAAAVCGASVLAMQLALDPWGWTVIRIIQGAAFAWMFSSIESWLSSAVSAKSRGSVSGFYHLMAKVALVVGPFFVSGLAPIDFRPYLWCAIFITLSLLPICLTRRGEPAPPSSESVPLSRLFELAPAAVISVFLAGVINSGTMALLPIYAGISLPDVAGGATGAAALAAAAAWTGGMITQWPAGRISDVIDRRIVVAIMAAIAGTAALVLGLFPNLPELYILIALGVWGAGSLSFYGIGVAHAIDRAEHGQISRVMAGLLFVWAVGSVIGPPLSGVAFRLPFTEGGLFLLAALLSGVLMFSMLWRRAARKEAPKEAQEPWNITLPTLGSTGEIDPRAE